MHSSGRILWRDLFLLLINIQLVVSVLCAQNTSDDQRRVARSVHFNWDAIPAEVARLTAFGVFMAPTAASRKHCA